MKRSRIWVVLSTVLGIVAVAASGVSHSSAAQAEKRVALVIGNSDYVYAGHLTNPVNDASDVAAALTRLGFEVTPVLNSAGGGMMSAVEDFFAKANGASAAFFYYAGHGLQYEGSPYLAPTDAKLENETAIKREAFSAQDIVSRLETSARASIVVLDACRNNPLAERLQRKLAGHGRSAAVGRGLGRIEATSGNTLLVYSAGPGQTAEDGDGRNSPFTTAFLKHVETPGLEVEQMLKRVTADVEATTGGKQQPERLSRLKIELWLKGVGTPRQVEEPGGANGEAKDIWLSLKDTTSETQLQQFIRDYGATPFGRYAGMRLRELEQQAVEALAAECDRLAASPYDKRHKTGGVAPNRIDAALAIPACQQATAANPNEPRLMFQLGRALYAKGAFLEAREWYEKAMAKYDALAMTNLGVIYDKGKGVVQDYAKAREWYEKAALKGEVVAMYNLGLFYEHGYGVAQNYAKAQELYEKAAAKGEMSAQNKLNELQSVQHKSAGQ